MNPFAWWTDRHVGEEGGGGPRVPDENEPVGDYTFSGPGWRHRVWLRWPRWRRRHE